MRLIDSEAAYRFLTEQLVKETGAFSKGVNKGINIARSAVRNPDAIQPLTQPNNWISVKDKLPELPNDDYCWVLVLACKKTSKKSMPMFYERSIVRKQRVERWKYYWDRIVTEDDIPDFWMPLPEPPKDENE